MAGTGGCLVTCCLTEAEVSTSILPSSLWTPRRCGHVLPVAAPLPTPTTLPVNHQGLDLGECLQILFPY